ELAEALRVAREALASAQASAVAAAQTTEREHARHAKCAEVAAAAERVATEARAALEVAWRETAGEGAPSLKALGAVMEAHQDQEKVAAANIARAEHEIVQAEADLERAGMLRAEADQQQAAGDLAAAVALELQGQRFIAYLLSESMHLLATDASHRLAQFTNGRYELCARDDEFEVLDRLNGDEKRSVKTLSGGETFLASLALSLSLSEHLPEISGTGGAVSLDSLFLDEGFGALDAEALDLAVQGLETLAEGSRMIGVISHVEELAERLTDQVRVEKGVHGSTIAAR
ncbi:MAG: SbcC/MukB-like Walker B domain-containing protein, partial [Dehalococcoidia bacterium]